MPRGAAGQAKKTLGTTNAIGAQQQTQANQLENNTLIPGYTNLMDTGYMSPGEEGAASTAEMGAATAPFGAAQFQANDTAAATRNASGQNANADQLALEEGQVAGQTAAGLQQQKMGNQMAGLSGLNQLYGTNTSEAESMYGEAPSLVNAESTAQMNNPMLHLGETIISAGGQAGAAALGGGGGKGPCWVAAHFHGWDSANWWTIRNFIMNTWWMTPFRMLYKKVGERWAALLSTHKYPTLEHYTKRLFDKFLEWGS